MDQNMKIILKKTVDKLSKTALKVGDNIPYLSKSGTYDDYSHRPSWWTNGFYPGILWHLYQITKDTVYADLASRVEKKLDVVLDEFVNVDHDAGFMWGLASVPNYWFMKNERSRIQGLKAASFLASRFHPKAGYIRAWNGDWAKGHSIIDSLMNLSILYWASKEVKDSCFYEIATKQADTALREFIREDGSVYHILVFDDETGTRSGVRTGQGYSETSSWGRGTSWALYGMVISYRETGDERYLQGALKVASFIQKHMCDDMVPYADYLAPEEERRKKDSSAGAITACGFLLLGKLTGNEDFTNYGRNMVQGLYNTCFAPDDNEAVLLHGNVAYHAEDMDETDISIIYGDYFFLEALCIIHDYKGLF